MAERKTRTKQEREAIVQQMTEMKNGGKTYQEIADEFGISRQRVHQMISTGDPKFFRYITTSSCIYKGLRKYMNDNKVSMAELVRRTHGVYSPRNFYTTRNRLSGAVDIPKKHIDKILSVTGLTYEVAFELEVEN